MAASDDATQGYRNRIFAGVGNNAQEATQNAFQLAKAAGHSEARVIDHQTVPGDLDWRDTDWRDTDWRDTDWRDTDWRDTDWRDTDWRDTNWPADAPGQHVVLVHARGKQS